jgi:DNA-binding CsgD family transcriptional regulator
VHTHWVADRELVQDALHLQRGAIAILDPDGNVTWADDAWAALESQTDLPRVPIGKNLLEAYRMHHEPIAQAVGNAIAAVFEGKATYFEIEHRASRESGRSYLTSAAALRGDRAGLVLIHRVVTGGTRANSPRPADTRTPSGDLFKRLTPREREVLEVMAAGLDNRAIAAKLRIQYTTVRGHVRAVIEKLGASSRLDAVARAYRNGWVTKE